MTSFLTFSFFEDVFENQYKFNIIYITYDYTNILERREQRIH